MRYTPGNPQDPSLTVAVDDPSDAIREPELSEWERRAAPDGVAGDLP